MTNLAKLREPFPPESIDQLPRAGITLDYVGHAWITDRLLDVDLAWSWEPLALTEQGSPVVSIRGDMAVMWIRLTVLDVTRLGVGIVKANKDELEKELISDALRNAAMRFGAALDLWKKTDRQGAAPARKAKTGPSETGSRPASSGAPRPATDKQRKFIQMLVDKTGMVPTPWPVAEDLSAAEAGKIIDWLQDQPVEPLAQRVATVRKEAEQADPERPF